MNQLSTFTNLYPLSKTLRFELIPEPREHFQWESFLESAIYNRDKDRSDAYRTVKIMLDQLHKQFIEDALQNIKIDWNSLNIAYKADKRTEKYAENLKREQDKVRKIIVDTYFKKHDWWKYVSKDYSKLFKDLLPSLLKDDAFIEEIRENHPEYTIETMQNAIGKFKGFSVYFGGYFKNRENLYKSEAQTTAIAYRIVHDNFPKFVNNIAVYESLKTHCARELKKVEEDLENDLKGLHLDKIFQLDFFNTCATQKGIEQFNALIGGKTLKGKDDSVAGINSVGNLFLHQNKDSRLKLKELKMTKLYKQMLSDRVRPSYIPEQFNNEQELLDSIDSFYRNMKERKVTENLLDLMKGLTDKYFDLNRIHVVGSSLTNLSRELYGNWDLLGSKLRETYVTGTTKKEREELEKEMQEWIEKKSFSLQQIIDIESTLQDEKSKNLLDLFTTFVNRQEVKLIEQCDTGYLAQFSEVKNAVEKGQRLKNNEPLTENIKVCLDNYINVLHVAKLLSLGKKADYLDYDMEFYEKLYDVLTELENIIPLYNKVRSFLTRKYADEGKMLLKFDSPTLANVWAQEFITKACVLVQHNQGYYLVINGDALNGSDKLLLKTYTGNEMAKRIVIDTQKPDNKNTPRLFIRSKGDSFSPAVSAYNLPIHDIIEIYDNEKFQTKYKKENEIDYYKSLHKLIDYFKLGFTRHVSYKHFPFSWKQTNQYQDIAEFYHDVITSCYQVKFDKINWDVLLDYADKGKIFLFQIFNKDFKPEAKGTPNMHTLYWKALFSEENLKNVVFKLNGEAELFYRKQLIPKSVTHKKGDVLVNKIFKNGKPVPAGLYKEYLKYFAGNLEENRLSKEAKDNIELVSTNIAKLDLIKDKRYTDHKFQFHVPITINFKSRGLQRFNDFTLAKLRESKTDINIIGIDRGERHLLYVSVINQKGENVIPPKSFNIIESEMFNSAEKRQFNYQEKLVQKEGDRDKARKNWNKIETIKELKEGYLSQVVHEIAKMIVEYKAIVVLEDLNFGFKRGRFNVERQVYQKFEKMLIDKLNYLVFKNNSYSSDYGNVLNGLQLTNKFTSFKELGKQSGWLFYVNASYTSKIDPSTGFVNLFNMKDAQKEPKVFFQKFSDISYRDGLFQFSFNYSNGFSLVGTDFNNEWTVFSIGERIIGRKDKASGKYNPETFDLTKELKNLFESKHLLLSDLSLKKVLEIEDKQFFDSLFYWFKLTLQMRNSSNEVDYLISPVQREKQDFFDSRKENQLKINDADANGAYHIALKGLYLLKNNFPVEKKGKTEYIKNVKNEEWLAFAQTRFY